MSTNNTKTPEKLVVFAGGKGSRLAELTTTIPKPAIDVCNRPLITYLCDWAFTHNLKQVLIAGGYKQDVLKRRLLDYYQLANDLRLNNHGVQTSNSNIPEQCEIIIRDTGRDTDTAERLFVMHDLLESDDYFIVTYGDTLTNLNPEHLIETARRTDKLITMCIGYPDARYGEIIVDNGIVTSFEEKKRPQFFVNRGFFVIKSILFKFWQPHFISFEKDVLPYFVARGEVAAHSEMCWFHSVDSLKDLNDLECYLESKGDKIKL